MCCVFSLEFVDDWPPVCWQLEFWFTHLHHVLDSVPPELSPTFVHAVMETGFQASEKPGVKGVKTTKVKKNKQNSSANLKVKAEPRKVRRPCSTSW